MVDAKKKLIHLDKRTVERQLSRGVVTKEEYDAAMIYGERPEEPAT